MVDFCEENACLEREREIGVLFWLDMIVFCLKFALRKYSYIRSFGNFKKEEKVNLNKMRET